MAFRDDGFYLLMTIVLLVILDGAKLNDKELEIAHDPMEAYMSMHEYKLSKYSGESVCFKRGLFLQIQTSLRKH